MGVYSHPISQARLATLRTFSTECMQKGAVLCNLQAQSQVYCSTGDSDCVLRDRLTPLLNNPSAHVTVFLGTA